MRLTKKITVHVNKLTESIYEVWGTVKAETHTDDPMDTLEMPLLLSPLKVELVVHVMETGMKEFDDVSHDLGTLSISFSKLTMVEVYFF